MSIRYITAFLLAAMLFSCSAGGKKELVIGKNLDEATRKVKDVTDQFDIKDTFAFTFNLGRPFGSPIITVRFYKANDMYDQIRCTSDDIKVDPKSSTINSSLQVEYFAGKEGNGRYFIYFIIHDEVVAFKSFMVGTVEEKKEPVIEQKPFTGKHPGGKAEAPKVPNTPGGDVFVPPVPSNSDENMMTPQ